MESSVSQPDSCDFAYFPIFSKMGEIGDMNCQTHFIGIWKDFQLKGQSGQIYGEFSKLSNQPDGRCIFVSSFNILLLYMNDSE